MKYAAKLMFQFRVAADGKSGKLRYVEERIVLLEAASARGALQKARRKGKSAQFQYENSDNNMVHFEFIGIRDLIDLYPCEEDEVWYDIRKMVCPMERRDALIPDEKDLDAIRNENRP